ncbi:hypothetical protein SERLA73DRAFT_178376 [Serpula lacrymans var. lacrymans S7.3]|uniref:DUF6533 domain-containing protein n=2 Tax=Serpula lacrymans var. lacrymans TaxID=341189 RepID=F8PTL1_SERL3|nr:uncharacterized protein SERLADRAFT_462786 [Serpula lacrymans var. lacrymans S7.9]EGO00539.1 hypothetical protein SERLA73DRAFT_178376 [Serpula lacrymans var. lacrymans S7.3]EGO26098.1 hypothetical protein SERLADRAFT_462786 [Serpula lacrymans var. lacrymans S7.9]
MPFAGYVNSPPRELDIGDWTAIRHILIFIRASNKTLESAHKITVATYLKRHLCSQLDATSVSMSSSISEAYQLQSVKYIYVACLPVLALEYCNTFEEEVKLIWRSRWSLAKVLFLCSRYNMFAASIPTLILTVGPAIPSTKCKQINLASAVLGVTSIVVAEAILLLRTIAIWPSCKTFRYCLVSLYLAVIISMLVSTFIYVNSLEFVSEPGLLGCNPVTHPDSIAYALVIVSYVIFHETIILTLLVYRIITLFRHTTNPLLRTLYTDGIGFYLCMLALSIANVIAFATFPAGLKPVLDVVYYTVHSVLSCRIILHLRAVNVDAVTRTLNPPSQSLQFARVVRQCHRIEAFRCESRTGDIPMV